jgi:hypothetical protein
MMEIEEGETQWMAWLGDRLCPRCGHQIREVVPTPRRCAMAYPCGHRVLSGAGAVERVRELWARSSRIGSQLERDPR